MRHAEKDPEIVHSFYPKQTEYLLFLAIDQYQKITGERSAEFQAFRIWYAQSYPKIFNTSPSVVHLGENLFANDRRTYWREFLPIINEQIDKNLE